MAEGRVTTSVGALDLATSASAASVARTHSDKENIADFIAKKREIFLVQVGRSPSEQFHKKMVRLICPLDFQP